MKNLKLLFSAILLVALVASCKKDTTDDRAQFLGTWTGTINSIVPDLSSNTSKAETLTITAGTASSSQIILTQTGSTVILTGNVSGNKYTYIEYTSIGTTNGIAVSIKQNGTGTLNGNIITESGTLVYTIGTAVYQGTWSSSLTKQ